MRGGQASTVTPWRPCHLIPDHPEPYRLIRSKIRVEVFVFKVLLEAHLWPLTCTLSSALGGTRTPNLLIRSDRAGWYWVLPPTTTWSLTSVFALLGAIR